MEILFRKISHFFPLSHSVINELSDTANDLRKNYYTFKIWRISDPQTKNQKGDLTRGRRQLLRGVRDPT